MKRIIALGLLLFSVSANAINYTVTVLPSLSPTGPTRANGINDNGMIVGESYNTTSGQLEAVYWDGGAITTLGVRGTARAVNNSGMMVGETGGLNAFDQGRAYSYDTSGLVYTDLGTLGGDYAAAFDINDAGVITGYALTSTNDLLRAHAFRYTAGTMTDLQAFNGLLSGYSRGHGINDSGVIAGRSSIDTFQNSEKHMTQWSATDVLQMSTGPYDYSTAQDVNNAGVIVGNGKDALGNQVGMIWDGVTTIQLGTLGGSTSYLNALNELGDMVGYSTDAGNVRRAIITTDNGGTITDLNSLVTDLNGFSVLSSAHDVNESGQIIGYGTLENGEVAAFLLTPVPVPAAVWLFGSALGLLGWVRRRSS